MKRIITKITRRADGWGWRVIVDGDEFAADVRDTYEEAAESAWVHVLGLAPEGEGTVGA